MAMSLGTNTIEAYANSKCSDHHWDRTVRPGPLLFAYKIITYRRMYQLMTKTLDVLVLIHRINLRILRICPKIAFYFVRLTLCPLISLLLFFEGNLCFEVRRRTFGYIHIAKTQINQSTRIDWSESFLPAVIESLNTLVFKGRQIKNFNKLHACPMIKYLTFGLFVLPYPFLWKWMVMLPNLHMFLSTASLIWQCRDNIVRSADNTSYCVFINFCPAEPVYALPLQTL